MASGATRCSRPSGHTHRNASRRQARSRRSRAAMLPGPRIWLSAKADRRASTARRRTSAQRSPPCSPTIRRRRCVCAWRSGRSGCDGSISARRNGASPPPSPPRPNGRHCGSRRCSPPPRSTFARGRWRTSSPRPRRPSRSPLSSATGGRSGAPSRSSASTRSRSTPGATQRPGSSAGSSSRVARASPGPRRSASTRVGVARWILGDFEGAEDAARREPRSASAPSTIRAS